MSHKEPLNLNEMHRVKNEVYTDELILDIKVETDTDCINDGIRLQRYFNDNDIKFDLQNIKKSEAESLYIKQHELKIKEEIPNDDQHLNEVMSHKEQEPLNRNEMHRVKNEVFTDELMLDIKAETDTDCINDDVKLLSNFNGKDIKLDLQYIKKDEAQSLNIKQQELDIKEEIPNDYQHSNDATLLCIAIESTNIQTVNPHSLKKQFTCNLCNFKTVKKWNLKTHMRIHTGEKLFACNLCEYKAARKTNLKIHIKRHMEEKQFACNLCTFKSYQKGALTVHMRIHNRQKLFACNLCEFKAIWKKTLLLHAKTHLKTSFICELCGFTTSGKNYLTKHMKVHTKRNICECNLCKC